MGSAGRGRDDPEVWEGHRGPHSSYPQSPEKPGLLLGDPDWILLTLLPFKRHPCTGSPSLPRAGSFPDLQLKQGFSVGPSSVLSKDPCVSLKRGIDRDVVRAAQPMAGWLGLARPRNFPKPSYFLFLGPAPSGPPGHGAQSRYTSLPVPYLPATGEGGGAGCPSTGPQDTQPMPPGVLSMRMEGWRRDQSSPLLPSVPI